MGKSRNRNRKKGPCPTGLPSVRDIEKEEDFDGESSFDVDHVAGDHNGGINKPAIRSLVEQLQSVSLEEKECACCIVASLAEREEALPLLLECNVIKALAPLMTISSAPVRHASVGALRNFSAWGDHDFCEAMVEQDVMTPLVALYKKQYGPGWQPLQPVAGKIDSIKEAFVDATYLLCNLCESSSTAIRVFNKESLVAYLLPALNVETYGHHVAIAVARCLHTVSEDNGEILPVLDEAANAEILSKLLHLPNNVAGNSLLRVLGAGIILNVSCAKLSGCSSSRVEGIMRCLADVLTVDAVSIAITMAENIKDSEAPGEADQENDSIESIEWLLSAQQIALEVLINICCDSEDVENWDDLSNSDDSEDMSSMDINMEGEEEVADVKFPLGFSAEIYERFISHDFLQKVLTKLNFSEENASQVLNKIGKRKKIYEKLFAIKHRALLCINNLVTCLNAHDLGGPTKLYELWINLCQLAFKQTGDLHPEILEASTSAMSSVIKKLSDMKSNQFAQLPLHDLQEMCELLQQIADPCTKVNLIRIFGSLGCLVGNSADENCLLLLRCIGCCLLSIFNKDCDLWVESEALDAIFDVFADDCHDSLLTEIGGIEKLKAILPVFKLKVKQYDRKSTHLPVIMTARTNLARFIKYKTNLQSTNSSCHN